MSIPTDPDRELLTVVASMRARAGKEEELQVVLESVVEPTRAEDGCHTYALHRGTEDRAVFLFYAIWASQAHLDAHRASPHIQAALQRLPELLDGELAITPLRRLV